MDPDDVNPDGKKNGKSPSREKEYAVNNDTAKHGSEEKKGPETAKVRSWDVGGDSSQSGRGMEGSAPPNVTPTLPRSAGGSSLHTHHRDSSGDEEKPKNDHMETMAGNLVSSLVDEDEPPMNLADERTDSRDVGVFTFSGIPPPQPVPSAEPSWTYLDPQGQIQGPFQSEEMLEWFTGGYFPVDLMVKRSQDTTFLSLSEVTKLYGRVPFTPGPQPSPFSDLEERLKHQQQLLQIHQQYLLQQQLLVQQQQQHQQLLALQQQQVHARPDFSKLLSMGPLRLGGLASSGDLIGGFGAVDPLRNLLGSLNSLNSTEAQDPLKQQFLSRSTSQQLDVRNNPPRQHQTVTHGVSPSLLESGSLSSQGAPLLPQGEYHHNVLPSQQHSEPPTPEPGAADFDPIQSLLQQLQSSRTASSTESNSPQLVQRSVSSQKIHTVPESGGCVSNNRHEYFAGYSNSVQYEKPQLPQVPSIWDRPSAGPEQPVEQRTAGSSVWNEASPDTEVASSSPPEDRSPSPDIDAKLVTPPAAAAPEAEDPAVEVESFLTPKLLEKKEKKSKKAEEKRRAKEAKKQSEQAGSLPYIPGMPGCVQPEEQVPALIISSVLFHSNLTITSAWFWFVTAVSRFLSFFPTRNTEKD